jgi:ABC-type transport system involved in cytochrome c biogenesis ATPase subunit
MMSKNKKIEWLTNQAKMYKARYNAQCDYISHLEDKLFCLKLEVEQLKHWKEIITGMRDDKIVNEVSDKIIQEYEDLHSGIYDAVKEAERILKEGE